MQPEWLSRTYPAGRIIQPEEGHRSDDLRRADVQEIEQAAIDEGMVPLRARRLLPFRRG